MYTNKNINRWRSALNWSSWNLCLIIGHWRSWESWPKEISKPRFIRASKFKDLTEMSHWPAGGKTAGQGCLSAKLPARQWPSDTLGVRSSARMTNQKTIPRLETRGRLQKRRRARASINSQYLLWNWKRPSRREKVLGPCLQGVSMVGMGRRLWRSIHCMWMSMKGDRFWMRKQCITWGGGTQSFRRRETTAKETIFGTNTII